MFFPYLHIYVSLEMICLFDLFVALFVWLVSNKGMSFGC